MKVKMKIEQEFDVKTLSVKAGIRYWEDATVDIVEDIDGTLIPCREGELWCPEIDIDSGVIINWKQGVKAHVHYKVCDSGSYFLKDANGKVLSSIEDNYVPSIMCPTRNGYGDYIIMDIDENGKIDNWKVTDLSDFNDED